MPVSVPRPPHRLWRSLSLLLLVVAAVLVPASVAEAKLDAKAWRQVKEQAARVFGQSGQRAEKQVLIAKLEEDGMRRSWDLLSDACAKEAEAWLRVSARVRKVEDEILVIQKKPMAKRIAEEQKHLRKLQDEAKRLEATAQEQRGAWEDITQAVVDGPEALFKKLLTRAKGKADWPVRAAAAQVAASRFDEKVARDHLRRALENDDDARVRLAGLEALGGRLDALTGSEKPAVDPSDPSKAEEAEAQAAFIEALILGRLADEDWGVQLLAVNLVAQRKILRAVPHLINGLGHTSPRVADAIGDALHDLTGENFEPYADVWAQWWEENKASFESEMRVKAGKNKRQFSDIHFYGLPIKSDRILFIIDASKSMELKTTNENPAEKWKPRGPVTGSDAPPPPPPPEEILSGPKILVAKHELKKALKKLPPTAQFNIIAFNSAVLVWKETMVKATDKNREDALQWVRALEPKGSTYIDGALRVAFRIAGIGAIDKAYKAGIDTIVLLSDGAPTDDGWPKAKLMDPKIILDHVTEWNQFRRVVIHCIAIDIVEGVEFLKDLAAQNGGEYIDR